MVEELTCVSFVLKYRRSFAATTASRPRLSFPWLSSTRTPSHRSSLRRGIALFKKQNVLPNETVPRPLGAGIPSPCPLPVRVSGRRQLRCLRLEHPPAALVRLRQKYRAARELPRRVLAAVVILATFTAATRAAAAWRRRPPNISGAGLPRTSRRGPRRTLAATRFF